MRISTQAKSLGQKLTLISAAFVLAVSTLTASVPFILAQRANAISAAAPSTNATNQANGMAYVEVTGKTTSSVSFKFHSTNTWASCFEYRADGQAATGLPNYNAEISDGMWSYKCVNNSTAEVTVSTTTFAEVRMVFGAEKDERFDWEQFNVLPAPTLNFVANYIGNAQYHGISLEITTPNLTDATGVEILVERTNGSPDVWVSNPANTNATDALNGSTHTTTAPIVIAEGTRTRVSSSSWLTSSTPWTNNQVPQSVTVTVNRASGAPLVQTVSLIGSPWTTTWPQIVALLPAPVPTDTEKPVISISPTAPGVIAGTKSFTVTVSDNEPLDTSKNKYIWVELYGVPDWSNKKGQKVDLSNGVGVFTVNTTTLPDGKYNLRVGSVEDAAGNKSGDKAFSYFTIDNTKPTGVATYFGGVEYNGMRLVRSVNDLSFKAVINDNNSVVRATFLVQKLNTTTNKFESFCGNWNAHSLGSHLLGGSSHEEYTSGVSHCVADQSKWTDGTYKIFHAGYDAAGNEGKFNVDRQLFVIDSTAPIASITVSPVHNGNYITKKVTVTGSVDPSEFSMKSHWFEITGPNGYVQYVSTGLNKGGNDYSFEWNTAGLINGTYNIRYVATDTAGNRSDDPNYSNPTILSVIVDNQGPQAHFTSTVPAYVNGNFGVAGVASDNIGLKSAFFDIRDASGWVAGCAPNSMLLNYTNGNKNAVLSCDMNTTNLVSGQMYTLRIHASDNAGYGGGESAQFMFDSVAPTTPEFDTPTNEQYFNTSPILNSWKASTDDDSGVATYQLEYVYDDGHSFPNAPYREVDGSKTSRNHVPNINEQGGVTVRVRAIDNAGNVSAWSSPVHYYYDATAPAEPTVAYDTVGGTQEVTLTTGDNDDKIYYTIDGSAETLYTGPFTLTHGLGFSAYAEDLAGNKSTVLTVSAPVITNETSTTPTTTSIVVQWTTDTPTTSRVIYDDDSHATLDDNDVNYGYEFSTVEDPTKVTDHSVLVTGLTPGTTYYFRTVSHGSPIAVSGEISGTTVAIVNQLTGGNTGGNAGDGAQGGTTGGTPLTNPADFGVEGASDEADEAGVDGASTENKVAQAVNNTDGNAFGLAWYWWLLIAAGAATGIWWLIAALRRRGEEA